MKKRYYKIIDGQTVFFDGKLRHDGMITYNPTEEMILADGWLEYVEPEPTPEELLERARQNKLADIDDYDSSSNVNEFTINDNPLWLDFQLRQQLRTSIEAYQAMGISTVTKMFEEQEYTFPVTTWLAMLNALEVYAAEALNVTLTHKIAVKALNSIEDIEDYDITANYPQKLEFNNNVE